ncbi:galactose mutarotase [Opitutaceae bacterium]|jgi:aldose 1-epimerase|nr:galactose mutarotase [Opitutaceae bacterium]
MEPICFGHLLDGETVEAYDLLLSDGSGPRIITLGGIITSLRVPDRDGALADVVLGFNNLADYLKPHPYFGAIAGRVAGRINGAHFELDGRSFPLAANDPPNHLHGGTGGFSRRNWSATPLVRSDRAPSVRLEYHSPDGEDGYPGNIDVAVTYTFTAEHALIVEIEATTDAATPFSLTQHSYFNLAGEDAGDASAHELQIWADSYAPADDRMALLDRRKPVVAGGNDFRESRTVASALPLLHGQHGDLYFLPKSAAGKLHRAARMHDPSSGRTLTVRTDEPCLQFYTGVSLDDSTIGKTGQPHGPFGGLCLECEGYPNGPNTPELGDIILRPDTRFHRTTRYEFSNDR